MSEDHRSGLEHYMTSRTVAHQVMSNTKASTYTEVHTQIILLTRDDSWTCASTASMAFREVREWDYIDCQVDVLVDFYLEQTNTVRKDIIECRNNSL